MTTVAVAGCAPFPRVGALSAVQVLDGACGRRDRSEAFAVGEELIPGGSLLQEARLPGTSRGSVRLEPPFRRSVLKLGRENRRSWSAAERPGRPDASSERGPDHQGPGVFPASRRRPGRGEQHVGLGGRTAPAVVFPSVVVTVRAETRRSPRAGQEAWRDRGLRVGCYLTVAGDLVVDRAALRGPPDERRWARAMISSTRPTARRPMTPAMIPLATLDVPPPSALNW